MSFLGLNKVVLPTPEGIHETSLHGIGFYYEKNTTVYKTPEYELYIIGHTDFTPDNSNIEKLLELASGTFCYVLSLKDKLVIGTDAMGFYPLFYSMDEGLSFANFIPHLKHRLVKPKINWDAWNELLNGGDIIGNKTTISGILRLREGEKICYRAGQVSFEHFSIIQAMVFVDSNTYIEKNNQLLNDVMSRLTKNQHDIVIPLTGGHDSRRIAIIATGLAVDYTAVTQEVADISGYDVDTHIAKKVAKVLDIKKYTKIDAPEHHMVHFNRVYKDYWCGFESPQHEWAANITKELAPNSLIFDGIIGDITVNNHPFFDPKLDIDIDYDVDYLAKRLYKEPLFRIQSELLSESRFQSIKNEITRYPSDCNQVALFKTFNHARRNTGHWFSLFLHDGHNMALPYGDLSFFNQSLSLEPKERSKALYQRECMLKQHKVVAELESTRDNLASDYGKKSGAKKATYVQQFYPQRMIKLDSSFFSLFEGDSKIKVLDALVYRWLSPKILKNRSWKYVPLQRLALFQQWLANDESELPLLFKGTAPFVKQLMKRL